MVTVGATFQDGPRERQDAVTLATSSLLERQVLPRCPGNSRVLRFTGKRWLIHWDLSLWITVVFRNCLSAPLCIFFFFFFASASVFPISLLFSLPFATLSIPLALELGKEVQRRQEDSGGTPLAPRPGYSFAPTPHSCNTWSSPDSPEASSTTSPSWDHGDLVSRGSCPSFCCFKSR